MGYDRTEEFVAAAESFQQQQLQQQQQHNANTNQQQQQQQQQGVHARYFSDADRQFNSLAAEMGNSLHATSLKLQELGRLSRQCGIYNDKTPQIQELTFDIRKSLNTLNNKVDIIDNIYIKEEKEGKNNKQRKEHHKTVINVLKQRLVDVTKEFKDILILRAETLKRQDIRRNLYSFGGDLQQEEIQQEIYDIEGGQRTALVSRQTNSYSQARAEAVENVQRVIGELAGIFQRVATMIAHQEEMIQRIDQDLDHSMHHIREGQHELLNFYNRISSNRSLIIKVFLMLMAFILFFVFFLS